MFWRRNIFRSWQLIVGSIVFLKRSFRKATAKEKCWALRTVILEWEFSFRELSLRREILKPGFRKIGKLFAYKKVIAVVTIVATVGTVWLQNIDRTSGATFTFDQTQWQATPTGGNANHNDNQSSFTDYTSKSANLALTGGSGPYDSATISSSSDTKTQTADADFNAGVTDQTSVGGNSVGLSPEPGQFGDGGDGAWTISTAQNINTNTNGNGGRTCADGIAYNLTGLAAGTATLSTTPTAGCLNDGDKVMLLNLQGDGTDVTNVGNYEFLTLNGNVTTTTATFTGNKTKYYGDGASDDTNIGTATTNQRVILQRIPQYTDVTIQTGGSLTANAWDGTKGGVLAFNASGTVDVQNGGSVTMSAKGYRYASVGGDYYKGESYNKTGAHASDGGWGTTNLGGGGADYFDDPECFEAYFGGGSYGTNGQSAWGGQGGVSYGSSSLSKLFMGSAGGANNNIVVNGGGGIIFISADNVTVTGAIQNAGMTRSSTLNDYAAASAGGSIYVTGSNLTLGSSLVNASGGAGYINLGVCQDFEYRGNGGVGRIHLKSSNITGTTSPSADTETLSTVYYSSGTFTSNVIDVGQKTSAWGNFTWNATLNSQTLNVKARTCDDAACAGEDTAKNWDSVCTNITSGQALSTGSCATNGDRYVQYQAALSTADTAVTPTLDQVQIGYSYYPTDQTIVSSWYNTTDSANLLSKIIWDENSSLPTGTTVKFQAQTAPDSAGSPGTATGWVGPDGTSGSYFSNADSNCAKVGQTVTCNVPSSIDIGDGTDDQWVAYQVFFTSDGQNAPQLDDAKLQYVVNGSPTVSNVTASENSAGVLQITYDVADVDNATQNISFGLDTGVTLSDNPLSSGATTITLAGNFANLPTGSQTLQIEQEQISCASRSGAVLTCTGGRAANSTRASSHTQNSIVWFVNTAPNATGAGAGISNGTGKTATWNIKADLTGVFNAAATVRVMANDGQLANQMSLATGAVSAGFTLDTKNPTSFSFTIDHTTDELTLTTPTDDSSFEMSVSNVENTFSTFASFASPFSYADMTTDPATVYVRVKDAYGNYIDAQAVTPARPSNPIYFDTSNSPDGIYQEFIAWDVVSASQVGSGFASYKVYRQIAAGSFTLLATMTDRNTNYFLDKIHGTSTESDPAFDPQNPSSYTYKIVTEDTTGNISAYSVTVTDTPNGVGGSDSTPPTITDVEVSSVNTTSAKVTWTTDELSDSSVGYSTGTSYLPERGLASMVTAHEIMLTGLTPDTTYNIRVKSHDQIGNLGQNDKDNPGSSPIPNFTFSTHPGPAISQVTTPNISNHQATITWKTTTDSNTYVVYSPTTADGSLVDPEEIGVPTLVGGSTPFDHTQTITTYQDVDLLADTTYYFYVKSVDGSSNIATDDNGGNFYQLLTTEDVDPPVLTGINEAIINNTEVAINWVTDEPATSVVNYGTEEGGPYTDTESVLTYDASHYVILSGLDPNTTYYYTVTSADINTNADTSGGGSFTTLMNPEQQHDPLASLTDTADPANDLTAAESVNLFEPVVLTDTTAVIDFVTDQIAKCSISYREDGSEYASPDVVVETGYNTNHTMHIMSLVLLTKYYYTIECVDNLPVGQAGFLTSQEFSFTTLDQQYDAAGWGTQGDHSAPEISSVSAGTITGESVTVTWDTNEAANSLIKYGIVSGTYEGYGGDSTVNDLVVNYATAHTVVINNLTPGTKYFFKAMSTDAAGNIGESTEASFTTKSAANISGVKATSTKLGEATITWSSSAKTTSIVEYGIDENYGEIKQSTTMTTDHSVVLSGLKSNVEYFFIVKGKDASNNLYSSQGKFTPKSPPTITNIQVDAVTEHGALVKFVTNIPTDANIAYTDPKEAKNSGSQGKPELATEHAIELKNLAQGTTFSLKITAKDQDGNQSEDASKSFTTGKDENAPKLDQIRTDSALAQNDKVQTIISWITDEPATTAIIYQEGRTGEKKELKISNSFTTSHVAVITSFKSGVVYYFNVKSLDQSGNEAKSGDYALLTPKNKDNIIQIIIKNFTDIFGWAQL
ncbi:MAG: fibronectin type III domain-containing protein [Parcubacteria group bacterium]